MSIEDARREAFDELRELLSEGVEPNIAIAEAAKASGLKIDVITQIGARLVDERERLVRTRKSDREREDRKRRADKIINLYREQLTADPNVDSNEIEAEIGVLDFTESEKGDLFLRELDAYLDRVLKGSVG